jgi:hypothetical protein
MTLDFANLDPSLLAPVHTERVLNHHFVEFYDNDPSLIDSVDRFVSIGIGRGDAAIVVAEQAHLDVLKEALSRTINLEAATEQGLFVALDAEEALSSFMVDDMPDREKFEQLVGGLIDKAAAGSRAVRVFGEMVSVLWKLGNVAAALSLEDHWNRLSESHDFRLFCAYPTGVFGDKNVAPLRAVCDRHSHVLVSKVPSL